MHNVKDLNIERELLPLFDHSLNLFAKKRILQILENPLNSTTEILTRQNVLKGFAANSSVLENYSYTVLYLNEVHFFLNDENIEDLSYKKLSFRLFASKQEKAHYLSRCNQLVIFFHRLWSKYFSKLDLAPFPEEYRRSIERILQFLSCFELHKYESIMRESGLKDKQIIELTEKINVLKKKGSVTTFWDDLFLFEAYLSINYGIKKNNLTYPEFAEKGINLTGLYHPLLGDPIKNDFKNNTNVIVLNGPNMSGKSTFLKAVGICIYFGHLGIGIPASAGTLPFFDHIFVEINRRDDLLKGYSHFMTEIVNLKSVVESSSNGKSCFAIFDELFSGTNVEDGFEICKTTINGLSKFNKSYFFISTHIQELRNVANENVSTYYIDCELIGDKPTFTYQLKKGWSDIKVGRVLFEREGLNKLLTKVLAK